MVNKYTYKDLVWIDVIAPTATEIRAIMEEYDINHLVGEELLSPSLKPKIDLYRNYIYLIMHFPALKHSHKDEVNQEIDFVIGNKFLITTHYDTVDPLHKFSKVFEVNSILEKADLGDNAGSIFYHIIKKLYRALSHELDFIGDKLKVIEERIFLGNEKQMVYELSKISRELLQFKTALDLHDEVLNSFSLASKKFFGSDFEFYIESVIGAYTRVNGSINSHIGILNELRATNDSLLSAKQNEIMKNIAIVSFISLPLALIAGIFGMNTTNTPIVSENNGFFVILGVMLALGIAMIAYFHHKKWI